MPRRYLAERATSPTDGTIRFVVVDEEFDFHKEATAYLAWLRAVDRSHNTERVYAGRLARFLNHCEQARLDWRQVSVEDLSRYLKAIVSEPINSSPAAAASVKFPTNKTANSNLTVVCEFLKFAASRNWVSDDVVEPLSRPKYLSRPSKGHDWGENEQYRPKRVRAISLREIELAPDCLSDDEIARFVAVLHQLRDRLLVRLLAETGMRIGEALGLRRADMHLLSSSAALGCRIAGPHVHVRRRPNSNGATSKSRVPRSLPVTSELVRMYAEYLNELSDVADGRLSDFVFVNTKRPPLLEPMTYHNVKKMFERSSRAVGFSVRPHMLRHSAATRWLSNGTPRDVVQSLLGHVSAQSMEVYCHPTDADKRAAVENVDGPKGVSPWTL